MDDLDYLDECLNAVFFYYKNNVFLSDLTNRPSKAELEKNKNEDIEKKYNHFHMSFITHDYPMQKKYALQIWDKWRKQFKSHFPHDEIEIEISDSGSEIILWVYKKPSNH